MSDMECFDPEYDIVVYQNKVYTVIGNTFTLLTDTPIRSVYSIYSENYESINACYGIALDNRLVRLYPDGSTPTVLYQGTNIRTICASDDSLVILDEDQVIQLDLREQKYRTVFRHENILWMYFEVESSEVLYIYMNRGLHSTGYLFSLVTGEVKEEGYRL